MLSDRVVDCRQVQRFLDRAAEAHVLVVLGEERDLIAELLIANDRDELGGCLLRCFSPTFARGLL